MKNKKLWKKPYRKLIKKVFIQMSLLALLAIVAVISIRSAGQGYIGNLITKVIAKLHHVSWNTAVTIYFKNVRSNLNYILWATILIFFLLFIWLLLLWFTKYFDEIISGINELASGQPKQITMSPELGFVSDQLNKVNIELLRSVKAEREAEKRKNDLIVYLAHDIKTPLTSVIGYLSLLDENPKLPEDQRNKYTQIALEKAYRLESLVGEFFEIARYNLDAIPLQKDNINLNCMMEQIVDESYPLLTTNNKSVAINIPQNLKIYADPDKMARAFNNILKNAISYSAGSHIEISGYLQEDCVMIRFENAGTIPQDKLKTIFEKFCRLDDARQSATGGSGLGLAIAKDIVVLHGGNISANSKEDRTVFTILLPVENSE